MTYEEKVAKLLPKPYRLLRAVTRAAEAGLPCPNNEDLCTLTGIENQNGVGIGLKRLEEKGLLTVERPSRNKRIIVLPNGKRTT